MLTANVIEAQSDAGGGSTKTLWVIEDTAQLQRDLLVGIKERLYAMCNGMVELNRMTNGDVDIIHDFDSSAPGCSMTLQEPLTNCCQPVPFFSATTRCWESDGVLHLKYDEISPKNYQNQCLLHSGHNQ